MDKFIQFITQEISDNGIQEPLECGFDEARLLQSIARSYAMGVPTVSVIELLRDVYGTQGYKHLRHLDDIDSLIKSGWISTANFSNFGFEAKGSNLLSLLQSDICLSPAFLRLLEQSIISYNLPESTPYVDHLEYLKDQFARVGMYKELALFGSANQAKNKVLDNINLLESRINERIKITKIPIKIEHIFKEHSLDSKEQLIFLALLKEEYAGEFEAGRDVNALINLISFTQIDRMKNRSLLEEGSRLIEAGLIDYDEVLNAFGSISRNFFIVEDILHSIMHPQKLLNKKLQLANIVKEQDVFELIEPNTSIDDVVLSDKTKELLDTILRQLDRRVLLRLNSWGIKTRKGIDAKIIFYGEPGTGKTMSAISLAKSLKKQILSFDCSKILSKYIGESEQNVRKIFDKYKEICIKSKSEPVLLLNEADQFLSTRIQGISGAEKMHNQMQNIFLEQIERFEGVLIATTNFLESLDSAFSRRFDYKIEFKRPDYTQRLAIWRKVLPENASYDDNFSIERLAEYNLSGAQIVLVMKNTALKVAVRDEAIFSLDDFKTSIERELNSSFGSEKKVGLL